ncbi:MAG: zinc ribbon domain-containing protein [Ktedonobacteraceae bacterium]
MAQNQKQYPTNDCPQCGGRNRSDSRFCHMCGSSLQQSAPQAAPGQYHQPVAPVPDTRELQRQQQWLWQEEQRLLSQLAGEQATYASIEMALGLLTQQRQWHQTQQRTQVIGQIVVSGILGLQRTLGEQNYLYALRMLEQEILRHQFLLVQSTTRMEALKANLSRLQTEVLRVDALLHKQ